MKAFQFLFILIFSSTIMLGCGEKSNDEGKENVETGGITEDRIPAEEINTSQTKSKAPEFALNSIDGKKIKLSDYRGKIVLIDFWATWCGPCRRGVPDLVEMQTKYKDNLVVLGISLDQFTGTADDIVGFMKEFKINYPVLYGDQRVVEDYGNIQSIPTSFVVDQEGNVVDMHVGLVPQSVYEKKIKSLMGGS